MTSRPHADAWLFLLLVVLSLPAALLGQANPADNPAVLPLYRRLQTVGIDPQRVYKIREAAIDREDIHLWLNDGIIGFFVAVDGHVTGAYFEGDGEVLIRPPDRRERASLGLFTGEGVLEEKFSSAYLRFNDETANDLQPYLRPTEDSRDFIAHNNAITQRLSTIDAMRLCISFTSGPITAASGEPQPLPDRLLHARVSGTHLGVFDVYFDTRSPEQIVVGKATEVGDEAYYDLWMSFPMRSLRKGPLSDSRFHGPTGPVWTRDATAVKKYAAKVTVTPPRDLAAEATLEVEVRQGGPRVVLFELSRYLQVKKVEVDGTALEFIQNEAVQGSELSRRGNDLVAVVFPEPLRLGSRFALRFTYAGQVLSDAGGGLVYVGARGTWYPNRGIAMADYDLTFRFPQNWTLVATGKQVSLDREGADFVGRWVSEQPIPVAGFNLGQYIRSSARAGNVEVVDYATQAMERTLVLPKQTVVVPSSQSGLAPTTSVSGSAGLPAPDPALTLKSLANRAADTLTAYSEMLGAYPFSTLSLTQRPGPESQGWPGLIFLSSYVYLTPTERNSLKLSAGDSILFSDVMMPHELAHQWFGDKVSWASYHEQWLLEALANYCSLLLLERTRPADVQVMLETYRSFLGTRNKEGRRNVEAGPVTLGVRLSSSKFPAGYEIITYGRGTWLIHMLRTMLRDASRTAQNPNGDDSQFLAVLRNLVERHQGKELTNAEFQEAVEEVLPRAAWFEGRKSLDWFFDGWVNGTAFPQLQVSDVKISSRTGSATVSGVIHQTSAPQDLVTSVPVYGVAGDRRVYLGRVFAEGDDTRFTLPSSPGVTRVLLDPYATVLTAP